MPTWVVTDPVIPDQFSLDDYTKSYLLKSYDMTKSLHKELKKLRKWWTKEHNAERKGAKSVQDGTADKREERILCFLGFVQRYHCRPSDDIPDVGTLPQPPSLWVLCGLLQESPRRQ